MFEKVRTLRPIKSTIPDPLRELVEATGAVVGALALLSSDAERMRVLAAASAVYGREPDARWFLIAADDPQARSSRCGRCGQAR
jgi:hypothetical protein